MRAHPLARTCDDRSPVAVHMPRVSLRP
jgi:hypothetical protein